MKVLCLLSLALTVTMLLDCVYGAPSQQSDGIDAAGDRYTHIVIYARILSIVAGLGL